MVFKAAKYISEAYENEYVILNPETRELHLLNQVAVYILENCQNKNVRQIARQIYEECIDRENLSIDAIEKDCEEVLKVMLARGLVSQSESKEEG